MIKLGELAMILDLPQAEAASAYLVLAGPFAWRARVVCSVADLHHLREARRAAYKRRPELHAPSRRMRTDELFAAARADAALTNFSSEATLLNMAAPAAQARGSRWSRRVLRLLLVGSAMPEALWVPAREGGEALGTVPDLSAV